MKEIFELSGIRTAVNRQKGRVITDIYANIEESAAYLHPRQERAGEAVRSLICSDEKACSDLHFHGITTLVQISPCLNWLDKQHHRKKHLGGKYAIIVLVANFVMPFEASLRGFSAVIFT